MNSYFQIWLEFAIKAENYYYSYYENMIAMSNLYNFLIAVVYSLLTSDKNHSLYSFRILPFFNYYFFIVSIFNFLNHHINPSILDRLQFSFHQTNSAYLFLLFYCFFLLIS